MSTVTLFHRQHRVNKKQVAGIATGAAVIGAATAMLLTPKSGKEMRGHAVNGARRAKHRASHMAHRSSTSNIAAQGGADSEQWSENNQDAIDVDAPRSTAS